MARQIDRKLEETWRQRIERQRQGSLSVGQFCAQEGVSTASFYGWRRRLQGASGPGAHRPARRAVGKARAKTEGAPTQRDGSSFVQVPLPAPPMSPWIEIVLAEGAVVRLPQQNLVALQAVLQSLQGASPLTMESRHA